MGKLPLHKIDFDDFDEFEEIELTRKLKRKAKNGKHKENYDEDDVYEPQRMPSGWREGDSFIGLRRKGRSETSRPL
jgi:hypothetical protein